MLIERNWMRASAGAVALFVAFGTGGSDLRADERRPAALPNAQVGAAEKTPATPRTEIVRERYPSQAIKVERTVTQDERLNFINHVAWTCWDPAGTMVAKGAYRMSKRHGDWKRWFVDPAAVRERDPKDSDNAKDATDAKGVAETTDAFSGFEYAGFVRPFVADLMFADDALVGEWKLTDAEGKEIFTIEVDNGVPNGKVVNFFSNKNVRRQVSFRKGVVSGEWKEWDAEHELVRNEHYVDGCRLAEETLTYDTGEKLAGGVYLHANAATRASFDWWTGKLDFNSEPTEGKQLKQGKWAYWHKTGEKRSETEFIDNKPIGTHVWYFRNGQKECEGRYVDGVAHGAWQFWHENGLPAYQGEYEKGRRIGLWMAWNAEGAVTENVNHGVRNVVVVRRPNGQPAPVPVPVPVPVPDSTTVRGRTQATTQGTKTAAPQSDGMNPPSANQSPQTTSPTVIYRR